MKLRAFVLILTLALGLLAAPVPAEAQKKAGKTTGGCPRGLARRVTSASESQSHPETGGRDGKVMVWGWGVADVLPDGRPVAEPVPSL